MRETPLLDVADRQIEEVRATIEEAESVLERTAHLLGDGADQ